MIRSSLAPDLVLRNARIHTVDEASPVASAVAVKNGRFVAVGTDVEVGDLAGAGTRVEDLGGATVVPGLIDAHNHLLSTGLMLGQVQLYGCRSISEVVDRVAERVRSTPPGSWVVGRGWDESLLAERRHPTRHDLDAVAPHHPVVIHRVWNKLVANSAALRLAGITATSPDPSADVRYSGSFERDATGEPTGLFRDRAKDLITAQIPDPTGEELVAAIERACHAYNTVGITGVAEPGLSPYEIRAFHQARQEGRLTVRTDLLLGAWGYVPLDEEPFLQARFAGIGVTGRFGDDLLRLEGIKFMPDGGVGDRTAKMREPYLNEPDNRGTWVVEPGRLAELIRWVHDLGWSIDTHTCGDEAQETVVRAYVAAQQANSNPRLRHRVHHAYFPTPETLRLMGKHRIPALVSAPFLTNLGESFIASVGEARAAEAMPMRSYLGAGVPLAATSDAPITDFNPWVGFAAAVTRRTVAGRVLGPAESLTPAEALRAYTLGGAFATGLEHLKGSIEPGKLADLTVLNRDPLAIAPEDLQSVRPIATLLGGQWVFDAR